MTGNAGFYSIIQYCPDRFRAEAVNLGVLLFCAEPRFLQARMSTSNSRVRKLFGADTVSKSRLSSIKSLIAYRINSSADELRTLDDLNGFIATRGNDVRLTPARLVKVSDPAADLNRLFSELVEPDSVTVATLEASIRYETLPRELVEVLHRLTLSGKVRRLDHVVVPVLGRKLDVPYAYQNGVLNLIKPEEFSVGKRGENLAMRLAVEGDLIKRHSDANDPRQLIVVSAGEDVVTAAKVERQVEPLFNEYGVRMVRRSEVGQFAREVEQQAH